MTVRARFIVALVITALIVIAWATNLLVTEVLPFDWTAAPSSAVPSAVPTIQIGA